MIAIAESISAETSRYGQVRFNIGSNHFEIVQGEHSEKHKSSDPEKDAHGFFEKHFQYRKPRVYCNKALADLVDRRMIFFAGRSSSKLICFFRWPSTVKPDGSIVRSEKSMELSFNMPHEFMKKNQVKRMHLFKVKSSSVSNKDVFQVLFEDLVTWETRNKRFDHPVITIG
jgi:hypothetical protein